MTIITIDGDWVENEKVEREAFDTHDGRHVGTETIHRRVWQGRDVGYYTSISVSDTRTFYDSRETAKWIDELHERLSILRAANLYGR